MRIGAVAVHIPPDGDGAFPTPRHVEGRRACRLTSGAAQRPDPFHDHDLAVRRFHPAGRAPGEIAVILNSQGLRAKRWTVTEISVRGRLEATGPEREHSRTVSRRFDG